MYGTIHAWNVSTVSFFIIDYLIGLVIQQVLLQLYFYMNPRGGLFHFDCRFTGSCSHFSADLEDAWIKKIFFTFLWVQKKPLFSKFGEL